MKKLIRIGIICPSEIALRRFLPALNKVAEFRFAGVAVPCRSDWPDASEQTFKKEYEKAKLITESYGGKIFASYNDILNCRKVDALYIPLPPALHYVWAKRALMVGKHVLVEKPATTLLKDTRELISLAKSKNLALHENYMFAFHQQIVAINRIIQSKEIGDVRFYRIAFGFPRRASTDFRYNKALGGGAMLDAGGYTLKYASILLGDSIQLRYAHSQYIDEFEVDIAGSAVLINDRGIEAHIAFGMDNSYKCELEVWGTKGSLYTGRVLTAPAGYVPEVVLKLGNEQVMRKLPEDDAFMKSIVHFKQCIENEGVRISNFSNIEQQAILVQQFIDNTQV